MQRIVGANAAQFIAECSKWVRHYCPLNSRNWPRMDARAKQDLFDKIKAEWNLPTGTYVDRALKLQCAMLYRNWRYRLKEENFVGKTREEAIANVDPNKWVCLVDFWSTPRTQRVSASNKANREVQTIKSSNGALSTARIFHELRNVRAQELVLVSTEGEEQSSSMSYQEPMYVELWEKTKRHKDGSWDPDAEATYKEFKELHAKEVELNGKDDLSVEEAYTQVLKVPRGSYYYRGLGAGPRPPRKTREGDEDHSAELQSQLTQRITELEQASTAKEELLRKEIEDLKVEQHEQLEKLKQEFEERQKSSEENFMRMIQSMVAGNSAAAR